jgi:hypothetical protein
MFKLNDYHVKIDIQLNNGVYIFDNESATGKTRLAKLLLEYQSYGQPVSSYTFSDISLGRPIEAALDSDKFKVIMLDRYDMYNGVGKKLIDKCRKNSIILIDCKHNFDVTDVDDWCYIEMTPTIIEVTQ